MREIKFRGWSKDCNNWVCGSLIKKGIFEEQKYYEIFSVISGSWVVEKESIGQFTGLHDKNSIDIYDGDVLSKVSISELGGLIQYFYLVFWSQSDQGFKTKQYVLDENEEGSYWRIKNEGIFDSLVMVKTYNHVVGNIHQNPELIK